MTVGDRMRKIRIEKGLTQREVSARCHIAEPTIRKYESGRLNPKFETMEKIASALEVPVQALMGYIFTGRADGKDIYDVPRDVVDVVVDEKKPTPVSEDGLSDMEQELIRLFRELNQEGQEQLVDTADTMVSSGKYKKSGAAELGKKQA